MLCDKYLGRLDRLRKQRRRLSHSVARDSGILEVWPHCRIDIRGETQRSSDLLLKKVVTDAEFEAQGQQKGVSFNSEAVTLEGDAVLLRSAVENVVRNAIRHTPGGSEVQVSLSKDQGDCLIRVRDAGPGVQASQLELMFDPFTRTAEARERGSGGFGLGLAIARRAMLIHGGEASARNHPQGGLEVSLRLPLSDSD